MKVLVTDGENRAALAVTRSLGRRGCRVLVTGKEPGNISACSKFCGKAFRTPDPLSDGAAYSRAIAEIVAMEHADVIFPMTEQSIYCLNKARAELGDGVILACAPPEKMEAVSNKYKLFRLAEKLGVAVPKTVYVEGAEDFPGKKALVAGFPVVVKPAFSKMAVGEKIVTGGVMYATDPAELNRLYETRPVLRYPSLIQELIVGQGTGLFTLFDMDRHLTLFSHRRLLEKPPSGGVSVLSESISLDEEMVEAAGKLLAEVRWPGVAMVEFKRDVRDGKAKLMEINGRLWGSLQLAVSSGVDFPALCLDYYLGKKPESLLSDYRVGFRLKWFFGILDHLIIRLKKGGSTSGLHADIPSLWRAIWELVKIGGADTSFDVFESRDLMPFASEAKAYVRNLVAGH